MAGTIAGGFKMKPGETLKTSHGPVVVTPASSATAETYQMPEHGWTCFHCGETFTTPGAARQHFGPTPERKPGCVIKVELGGERGLLAALRRAEEELERYRAEDGEIQRELMRLQSRHSEALRAAEETGYARGLRDAADARQPVDYRLAAALSDYRDAHGETAVKDFVRGCLGCVLY